MPSVNQRGWTWIDDDEEIDEDEIERRRPVLDALAERWSAIHHEIEQEGFRRQADAEDGRCYEPEFASAEEADAFWAKREALERVKERARSFETQAIEEELEKLGARMMRPYEHWNEDEQLIQYMESRYDHEYGY